MLKVANSVINASQIVTPITFAGDVTLSTGNLVIGTSGKGIDFSVTSSGSGTMTSELLADYEEGTWTPTQGTGLTVIGAFSSEGKYTKIGRIVTITGVVSGATTVALSSGGELCGGLPFTAAFTPYPIALLNCTNTKSGAGVCLGTSIDECSAMAASPNIKFTITYFV